MLRYIFFFTIGQTTYPYEDTLYFIALKSRRKVEFIKDRYMFVIQSALCYGDAVFAHI